jgi:hypothetical protein
MLQPLRDRMRPIEGVFDLMCSVQFWSFHIYTMLAACAQCAVNPRHHGPLVLPGENKARIAKIINDTAALPFDYASNLKFDSERQQRITCLGPINFSDIKGKQKGTIPPVTTPIGTSPPQQRAPKAAAPGEKQPPRARPEAKDFSAFTKAGITVPPYPTNPPRLEICIADFMSHAKIPFDEGGVVTKCTRTHTAKHGTHAKTRLHADEILASFPKGYDRAAAKYQCCVCLLQRPLTAVKVMAAMDKEITLFK